MGGAKRWMMEKQEELEHITSLLVEHGAATVCENHGYPVDAEDGEAVESLKKELAAELGEEEAVALVDHAMENLYWECPGCVANMKN